MSRSVELTDEEIKLCCGALAGVAGIQGAWNPKHENLEMYRKLMNLKEKIEQSENKKPDMPRPYQPASSYRKESEG